MKIKQDPITRLWARSDGAVLLPPDGYRFKEYRWTFGCKRNNGYMQVGYKGKLYLAHPIVCRAFHGLPPEGKPFCDHINRIRDDNRSCNLRHVDRKENADNQAKVDRALARYGVRYCDDPKAYHKVRDKAYNDARREEIKAYGAAYRAKMRAQGLVKHKGSNGRYGWHPRIRKSEEA